MPKKILQQLLCFAAFNVYRNPSSSLVKGGQCLSVSLFGGGDSLHFLSVCLTRPESFNQAGVFFRFFFPLFCFFVCLLTNEISLTY